METSKNAKDFRAFDKIMSDSRSVICMDVLRGHRLLATPNPSHYYLWEFSIHHKPDGMEYSVLLADNKYS